MYGTKKKPFLNLNLIHPDPPIHKTFLIGKNEENPVSRFLEQINQGQKSSFFRKFAVETYFPEVVNYFIFDVQNFFYGKSIARL